MYIQSDTVCVAVIVHKAYQQVKFVKIFLQIC